MSKCGNDLSVKFLVPRALWQYFDMNISWKKRSAPWDITPVKILTTLLSNLCPSYLSARTSAAAISVWTLLSQTPSANISVWISRENNGAYLALWPQWTSGPCRFWSRNLHHLAHIQVQRSSRRQTFCLESPLAIFQYEHPLTTMDRTMLYGSSDNFHHTRSDVRIHITQYTSQCSNDLSIKYFVSKVLYTYFSMILPWKLNGIPWAMAARKKLMLFLLTSPLLSCSACPSSLTVSLSNKSCRKLSVTFSSSIKAAQKNQL